MDLSLSIWLVIVLAFAAANLPFVSERILLVGPRPSRRKSMWWRWLELVLLYGIVGLIAHRLEAQAGQVTPQGWEFYAITACLFLTFAFPGFIYRYLLRQRR
ncbi:DUF2818 family protein [Corticibacter populi]|uniref:DUF2818 family protein n=1 Tax=Corticibacter populi TaxID=1550736 RepID=A0A3M6QX78_9BURK|nr:DUF2818 family protein [Corticibacter populi]RMX07630.1 DUF2818 family protein [Corticibacter populi]RZS30131.1 uncharacterized protein DUF2818 [Corticibacter populi]